ncbi:HNH endonuclease [Halorussus sp. MSC15.2]|uniref:HNH endonuclease n=1 Tax=Halorussus sp. MSC15.2 TaxID=2283638 RepID=UPI0013D3C7F9|nr:HNH endonuclease signature motif containing protein [Halorussus sp. MSC15.2]NEU59171.1 HNH endonuclease [Halorussus sp. MSC15.2]
MSGDEVFSRLHEKLGGDLVDYSVDDLAAFDRYLSLTDHQRVRESVLRIAAHLTPRDALAKHNGEALVSGQFDEEDEPYEMIIEYLEQDFDLEKPLAKSLGQNLGRLWDDWDESSRSISYSDTIKKKLLKEQSNRCENCNVRIGSENNSKSFENRDKYKPIHEYSQKQTAPELDHIEPLSHFGDNSLDNFQVLCRFCNQGKGNKKSVDIVDQVELATSPIEDIDRAHRRRIFFAVTADTEECARCGDMRKELTIRKENPLGCYIVSNLQPVCVECVYG